MGFFKLVGTSAREARDQREHRSGFTSWMGPRFQKPLPPQNYNKKMTYANAYIIFINFSLSFTKPGPFLKVLPTTPNLWTSIDMPDLANSAPQETASSPIHGIPWQTVTPMARRCTGTDRPSVVSPKCSTRSMRRTRTSA